MLIGSSAYTFIADSVILLTLPLFLASYQHNRSGVEQLMLRRGHLKYVVGGATFSN